MYEKRMKQAQKELRVKSTGTVTLAKLTITSQDSPVIGNIVQESGDNQFAYARTVSRLQEMRSQSYVDRSRRQRAGA